MNLRMSHGHDHGEEEEVVCEEPQETLYIFDAATDDDEVPAGFNAVRVPLDATLQSPLDWSKAHKSATQFIQKGLKILWEIHLGLFDKLHYDLTHQGQFQAFVLSLQHFRDTLWEQFRQNSVGICLYRGKADMTRDPLAASDYLGQLAQILPDSIPKYILLDAAQIADSMEKSYLLSKERFFHFHVAVKGANGCGGDIGWDQEPLSHGYIGRIFRNELVEEATTGICLPSTETSEIRLLFQHLEEKGIPYRVIPENHLTISWHGLESLYVMEKHLTPQGRRMLNGFRAAGGLVIDRKNK